MNIEEALEFTDQGRVQTAVDDVRPDALFQMMKDLGEEIPDIRYLIGLHRVNDFDLRVLAHRINEVFDVHPSVDQLARLIAINEGEQQNEPGKTGRAAAMSEFRDLVTGKLKGGA